MQTVVLRVLRFIAAFIWYFFLIVFVFVEIVIVAKAVTGGHFERDVKVNLRSVAALPPLTPRSDLVRFEKVEGAEADLKLRVKVTPFTMAFTLLGFTAVAFAILSAVYQVRKVLRSIRQNEPFDRSNIRRLRIVALSLVCVSMLDFLGTVYNRFYLLADHAGDAAHYVAQLDFGINTIIMAMIVFTLSEIFRQAHSLKTENEAFV